VREGLLSTTAVSEPVRCRIRLYLGKRVTMVGEQRQSVLKTTPSVAGNVIGLAGLLRCPQYEESCSVRTVRSVSERSFSSCLVEEKEGNRLVSRGLKQVWLILLT
jgi:hypothetical protein